MNKALEILKQSNFVTLKHINYPNFSAVEISEQRNIVIDEAGKEVRLHYQDDCVRQKVLTLTFDKLEKSAINEQGDIEIDGKIIKGFKLIQIKE